MSSLLAWLGLPACCSLEHKHSKNTTKAPTLSYGCLVVASHNLGIRQALLPVMARLVVIGKRGDNKRPAQH